MERIVAFSCATGGYFCEDDFRNYHPEWVEPITQDYRGYTVCEIPPNGHGITVLMALGILNGMTMPEKRESAEHYHKVMEAIKLAFADTRTYVADPRYMKTKVSELLSPDYLAARRALITDKAGVRLPRMPASLLPPNKVISTKIRRMTIPSYTHDQSTILGCTYAPS